MLQARSSRRLSANGSFAKSAAYDLKESFAFFCHHLPLYKRKVAAADLLSCLSAMRACNNSESRCLQHIAQTSMLLCQIIVYFIVLFIWLHITFPRYNQKRSPVSICKEDRRPNSNEKPPRFAASLQSLQFVCRHGDSDAWPGHDLGHLGQGMTR